MALLLCKKGLNWERERERESDGGNDISIKIVLKVKLRQRLTFRVNWQEMFDSSICTRNAFIHTRYLKLLEEPFFGWAFHECPDVPGTMAVIAAPGNWTHSAQMKVHAASNPPADSLTVIVNNWTNSLAVFLETRWFPSNSSPNQRLHCHYTNNPFQ